MAQEAKEEPKNVQVAIQWCGGWGYAPKFKAAKQLLEKKFPQGIDVVSNKDAGTTGYVQYNNKPID